MTKQKAFKNLEDDLTEAIESWIQEVCMEKDWEELGAFVPETLSCMMSAAAMVVLEGVIETNKYFESQNMLKEN